MRISDFKRVNIHSHYDKITDVMDMSLSKLWEQVTDREAWHATVHGVTKSRTRLSDWTDDKIQGMVISWSQV